MSHKFQIKGYPIRSILRPQRLSRQWLPPAVIFTETKLTQEPNW